MTNKPSTRTRQSTRRNRIEATTIPIALPDNDHQAEHANESAPRRVDNTESLRALIAQRPELAQLADHAIELSRGAKYADQTVYTYAKWWKAFGEWADRFKLSPLPADLTTVTLYLTHLSQRDLKPRTIRSHKCAIDFFHKLADWNPPGDTPEIKTLMAGIQRAYGRSGTAKPPNQAHPLTVDEVRRLIVAVDAYEPRHPGNKRRSSSPHSKVLDELLRSLLRAFVLTSFFLARRGDELIRADLSWIKIDLETQELWLTSTSQKSKPSGFANKAERSHDPLLCPVRALEDWLERSAPYRDGLGRLFAIPRVDKAGRIVLLDDTAVAESKWRRNNPLPTGASDEARATYEETARSKGYTTTWARYNGRFTRLAKLAGVTAGADRHIGVHSTRRGLATELHRAGASADAIARHVGWSDVNMVNLYSDHEPTQSVLDLLDF